MSRSLWKGLYVHPTLFKYKVTKDITKDKKQSSISNTKKIVATKVIAAAKTKGRKTTKTVDNSATDLLKIKSRSSIILPEFVGKLVMIHTGDIYKKVMIKEDMVGFRFGEFALTRKFAIHTAKVNKKVMQNKKK
jgi:small subunit ribosomal protein S19